MDTKEERATKEYVQALEVLKKKFPALAFDETKLNPIEKQLFANRKGEMFKKLEKYKILKVYGSGTNSVVLKAVRGGDISAIRIGTEKWTPDKEYLRQTLERYKMAPEVELIVGLTTAPSLTLSVEGVIAEDFKTFLEKKPSERMTELALKCLLDKKYVLGMLHGDMHLENMAILEDGLTLGFIDFEFSELDLESIFTIPDFVPLLGSIKYFGKGTFLIPFILKYYKDTFNMDIDMSKVKAWSRGGYIYNGVLTSYKALNPNWERETKAQLAKMFPKLTLPKIIMDNLSISGKEKLPPASVRSPKPKPASAKAPSSARGRSSVAQRPASAAGTWIIEDKNSKTLTHYNEQDVRDYLEKVLGDYVNYYSLKYAPIETSIVEGIKEVSSQIKRVVFIDNARKNTTYEIEGDEIVKYTPSNKRIVLSQLRYTPKRKSTLKKIPDFTDKRIEVWHPLDKTWRPAKGKKFFTESEHLVVVYEDGTYEILYLPNVKVRLRG